ncbi:hypothetical protein [Leuconostoc pseudomesenteroides]|uniref:hypothetical protein n=1 Tax=Leuconostoc pseudomesenteroides TaxID=33968 RepID=UPI0032DEB4E8
MNLIPVLFSAEDKYGYMSDEAIAVFQKVMNRAEEQNGKNDHYEEVRRGFIEKITSQEKRDIMDMYTLGYSSQEVADYFATKHHNIINYWRRMRKEGKMPSISVFERNRLHEELFKNMNRGKFNDVRLIRRGRGDAK